MTKGLILVPKRFEKGQSKKGHFVRWRLLFQELVDYFNFDLQYVDVGKINIPKDIELIITFSIPSHTIPMINVCDEILKLPSKVKVIGYMVDLQCYDRRIIKEYMKKMFDRFDRILVMQDYLFESLYPQYIAKKIWVPHFFGPYAMFSKLSFNKKPILRCLMAGTNSKAYPLREFVLKKHKKYNYIDCKSKIPYKNYPKILNSYFCCIGTPGSQKSHVAKNIEIPATGSLLLCQTTQDILNLGFKPYEHYIPITKKNVFEQINKCITNHKDYIEIRKRARKHVMNNYSIKNRYDQVKNIIEKVLNN